MHIRKVLHPEIVADKRGEEPLRVTYKKFLDQVGFIPGTGFYADNPLWVHLDSNQRDHFLMVAKFKKENPGVYYVPKDFAEAISKVDRDIPVDLLPKRWFGYIAFADGAMYDDSEEVQGAYVFIGPPEETSLRPGQYEDIPVVLWISYVTKATHEHKKAREEFGLVVMEDKSGRNSLTNFNAVGRLLVALKSERFADIIRDLEIKDYVSGEEKVYENTKERDSVYRTLVNLVLYIHSLDADLVRAPSHLNLSNRERSKRSNAGKPVNECTVPLTLVSWNYKKPIQYNKDSTWVDTFMRFQRCGPGMTQVKLIWVQPHTRHFTKPSEPAREQQS